MTYEGIGEFIKLLDSIEEAIKPQGYTVLTFEQVHTWGEKSLAGKSLELRIVPIDATPKPKASRQESLRSPALLHAISDYTGSHQAELTQDPASEGCSLKP